jgi:hypothetical protein
MDLLRQSIAEAEYGKNIVEECISKSEFDPLLQAIVLVFPDNDIETMVLAYKYLDVFLRKIYCDAAIVISSFDLGDISRLTDKQLKIFRISDEDMQRVLRFASVASVASVASTTVISLKMPFNQKAVDLAGFKDITLEKIVCHCLYGLFDILQQSEKVAK